jgi:type IV secretion system protein TrbJ
MLRRLCQTAAVALVLGLAGAGQAAAQGIPVIDATAVAQLIESVRNQLEQLQQLQQQLAQQTRMVTGLGTSVMPGLQGVAQQTIGLVNDVQGLSYQLQNVRGQLDQLYPGSYGSTDYAQALALLDQMVQQNRMTAQDAIALQNRVAQNQPLVSGAVAQAVQASDAAPGQTAAIQATNQILAAVSTQLMDLQTVAMSQARVLETEAMRQQSLRAAGAASYGRASASGRNPTATAPSTDPFN